jgi:hypothetical protein
MGRPIQKGSTDQSTVIRIIDSTDFTPETAVEHNTAGIDLWWRREQETKTAITEAALAALDTAHSDGGIEHIGDGYYRLDLPDAAVAAGAGENSVQIGGTLTGMIVIGNEHALVDYDPYSATNLGLTDITAIKAKTDEITVHETTIAVVTDDKTFTLTASGLDGDTSADDDAWNNASVTIEDVTGTAKELRTVEDYTGSTKTIILDRNCKFNLAAGDKVRFHPFCTSNVVAAVITDSDKNDIVDKVWDEADTDHLTIGTKGLKMHHAGRGRY